MLLARFQDCLGREQGKSFTPGIAPGRQANITTLCVKNLIMDTTHFTSPHCKRMDPIWIISKLGTVIFASFGAIAVDLNTAD